MTNNFRGGSAAPRAMLFGRRRRDYIGIGRSRTGTTARSTQAGPHRAGALRSYAGERRGFSRKKPCNQADSSSPQMRKGRHRADSDLLFVSADDLEKNPEHENEPRWQPNPAKIIKVTPQKADFRLRKCQGVKCDYTGDSAAGTDTGN